MSADNGVYVLFTDTEKGPEYRVAVTQAIDNIYGTYNEDTRSWNANVDCLKETFGNSEVFYSLDEALDIAEQISYDVETEYGISVVNEFRNFGHVFHQ